MEEKKMDFEENEINPNKEMTEEEVNTTEKANDNSELDKVKSELQEQKDKFLRLSAEFDNYKRRNAKERIELMQTAGKEIIVSLLDVLDDSERAEKQLKLSNEKNENIEGTLLVFNKLKNILQQKGLTPMESINTDFDVEKHEAISEFEVSDDKKGKVIDEMVKGYYLNEKIIRFAKVVVGK
jgi:molecular chaperone GrpE